MNRFTLDDISSSPASDYLPSHKAQQPQRRNIFTVPDDIASTTPAAPPPSQLFGSSDFSHGVRKLQFPARPTDSKSSGRNQAQSNARLGGHSLEASANSKARDDDDADDAEDRMDGDESDDNEEDYHNSKYQNPQQKRNGPASLLKFSTNSIQQSKQRSTMRRTTMNTRSHLSYKGRPEMVPGLTRDIVTRMGVASLTESDTIIMRSEDLARSFDEECQKHEDKTTIREVTDAAAHQLIDLWKRNSTFRSSTSGGSVVGESGSSSPFDKAQYLATLLLELYHPPPNRNDSTSLVFGDNRMRKSSTIPTVLLQWLDEHHVNYEPLFEQVVNTSPAPSANELFWDAVEAFTIRGKFEQVMELLRRADMNYAIIDTAEGYKEANFSGVQLQQAEDAIYRARQLINTCPAFQSADWDLDGQDWEVYRKQLEVEIEHLAEQVSTNETIDAQPTKFIGMFGKPAPKAGLPFVVYQRLKTVYSLMLGDAEEIVGLAQDWIEASILLTVWWAPASDKTIAQWSFDVSRTNEAPVQGDEPYLRRLRDAFLCVTDPAAETGFQINTVDALEVGLGAVLQGDIQSCLKILQCLSLCVASTTAEVASWAGWFSSNVSPFALDQDDLMVLNYGSSDTSLTKDDILENYARALFEKDVIQLQAFGEFEGWELSFSILSRMDDQQRMHAVIAEMLETLHVNDQSRTAKLVEICEQFGLEEEGRKVSENFADNLVSDTTEYGTALLCYARAHAEHKVRQLIDLLNSYCLVQSKVYPLEEEMDPALTRLVSNPRSALQDIAAADPQAAEILQFYLAGYACIRRFYNLRDDRIVKGVKIRPLARKRTAANALVAAINSAADSIYGGLYDPGRRSAIQVDGLLTLLGEATALLDLSDGDRVFSSAQLYAILATVEDLETVSDRVYDAAEECMEAALRNYHGSIPPSPHAMFKKSVSSGTNSNFSFSLMGSEMLARSHESVGLNSLGSTVLVGKNSKTDVYRGWDWRAPFKESGVTGKKVLKHLRFSIAQELGRVVLEENNGVYG